MSFFEIFQPGLEHLRREKDRYKMLVSKPTHGGGAPLGIDLEAGIAKIKLPSRAAAPAGAAAAPGEAPAEPAGPDSATSPAAAVEDATNATEASPAPDKV